MFLGQYFREIVGDLVALPMRLSLGGFFDDNRESRLIIDGANKWADQNIGYPNADDTMARKTRSAVSPVFSGLVQRGRGYDALLWGEVVADKCRKKQFDKTAEAILVQMVKHGSGVLQICRDDTPEQQKAVNAFFGMIERHLDPDGHASEFIQSAVAHALSNVAYDEKNGTSLAKWHDSYRGRVFSMIQEFDSRPVVDVPVQQELDLFPEGSPN